MQNEITIEDSIALDDSCQIQFWAKGHHSWGDFVTAVEDHIKADRRDIPLWVVQQAPVKTIYQCAVPCRDSDVCDTRFVHSETAGRGSYPITLMDFWFPLHAYKPTNA